MIWAASLYVNNKGQGYYSEYKQQSSNKGFSELSQDNDSKGQNKLLREMEIIEGKEIFIWRWNLTK